jgi:hypothetical protein
MGRATATAGVNRASRRCRWFAGVAALALVTAPIPGLVAAGELRGVIIGINDYVGEKDDLAGAVADAQDIAAAMRRAGARDLTVLTDAAATKSRIARAWSDLVGRARPGDIAVFSYAGHGSQETEPAGRNGEKDGKNENFILGGFTAEGAGSLERIVDDEIADWLRSADLKGVRVVFIADSCHSGTMTRSASARGVRFRNMRIPEVQSDQLVLPPPAAALLDPDDFKVVTFVGATEESRIIPEVPISGAPRGALSFAFARALDGKADADGDGRITQAELVAFLVPQVHSLAEGQQTPQVLPPRPGGEVLIDRSTGAAPAPPPPPAPGGALLRLAVAGGSAALPQAPNVALVKEGEHDLVWNVAAGTVEHVVGGRVAENVTPATIGPILGKWAALKWLQESARGTPAEFQVLTGHQRYAVGQRIDVTLKGMRLPYLTLFNLPPDGRVEFFIRPNEVTTDWRDKAPAFQFEPKDPPFGAEHMVAILTAEVMTDLQRALQAMTTADRALGLRQVLEQMLGGREFQLGEVGIYTGEGG